MSGYTRNCGRWSCFSHQIPFNFNLETYLPSLPSLCPVDQISSFFIIIIKCLLSNPTEVAAVVTGVHDMRYLLPWYNTNREQFDAMKFLDRFNITFTFIIKFKFSSSSHFYDFQKPKSNIYETEWMNSLINPRKISLIWNWSWITFIRFFLGFELKWILNK